MITDTLSSDILEQQFGPTEVEVLYQDATTRIICTRVSASLQALELSHVTFIQAGVDKFPATHQAVCEGASIGKTFRRDGVEFIREEQAAYRTTLPVHFGRFFGKDKAATAVVVSIFVGPDKTPYAKILEIYSPDVKWPHTAGQPKARQLNIEPLDSFLANQTVV